MENNNISDSDLRLVVITSMVAGRFDLKRVELDKAYGITLEVYTDAINLMSDHARKRMFLAEPELQTQYDDFMAELARRAEVTE